MAFLFYVGGAPYVVPEGDEVNFVFGGGYSAPEGGDVDFDFDA
jgi:hypothetical protein